MNFESYEEERYATLFCEIVLQNCILSFDLHPKLFSCYKQAATDRITRLNVSLVQNKPQRTEGILGKKTKQIFFHGRSITENAA